MKNAPSFFDETADELMEAGLTNSEIAERSAGDKKGHLCHEKGFAEGARERLGDI